jgi:hypothetical protein
VRRSETPLDSRGAGLRDHQMGRFLAIPRNQKHRTLKKTEWNEPNEKRGSSASAWLLSRSPPS